MRAGDRNRHLQPVYRPSRRRAATVRLCDLQCVCSIVSSKTLLSAIAVVTFPRQVSTSDREQSSVTRSQATSRSGPSNREHGCSTHHRAPDGNTFVVEYQNFESRVPRTRSRGSARQPSNMAAASRRPSCRARTTAAAFRVSCENSGSPFGSRARRETGRSLADSREPFEAVQVPSFEPD